MTIGGQERSDSGLQHSLLDRWQAVSDEQLRDPAAGPAAGDGAVVTDVDGKTYLDLLGGIAVNILGHRHPAVIEAVTAQLNMLGHVSNLYATGTGCRARRGLVGHLGADVPARVFFCNPAPKPTRPRSS